MPAHDIIDNRTERLVDHINQILSSTQAARFAVGYFFLSGLEAIGKRLAHLDIRGHNTIVLTWRAPRSMIRVWHG